MNRYANDPNAPYTVVELWIGTAQHPRCTADQFTKDTLTITSVDTDDVVATYQPGDWKTSITHDGDHHPLYAFTAKTPARTLNFDLLKKRTTTAA